MKCKVTSVAKAAPNGIAKIAKYVHFLILVLLAFFCVSFLKAKL